MSFVRGGKRGAKERQKRGKGERGEGGNATKLSVRYGGSIERGWN